VLLPRQRLNKNDFFRTIFVHMSFFSNSNSKKPLKTVKNSTSEQKKSINSQIVRKKFISLTMQVRVRSRLSRALFQATPQDLVLQDVLDNVAAFQDFNNTGILIHVATGLSCHVDQNIFCRESWIMLRLNCAPAA
jgi:hypothetical protein